jgi:cysteine desulfurase family protein (TIGR01976 family)
MTTLTFHLARALGRSWGPKDEVVITELDHHGNVAPWRALEKERGVKIVVARMQTEDGTLDLDDVEQKINANTRLVAMGGASNALGTIVDVARVAAMARARHALVFVDAVHYAPHELVDVQGLGADFLAMSAYKFYGPHIGVLWGKKILLENLDVPKLAPAPEEAPERLETGTQNHEGIVGAGAAVDWLAMLSSLEGGKPPKIDDHESLRSALEASYVMLHNQGTKLFAQLWNGLGSIKGVKRFGLPPGARRTPTVSFRVDGVTSDAVAVSLAQKGLFVSHGDFYAATIIERLGNWPDGVVRVGCSAYTTAEEIQRVIDAVSSLT